MSILRAEVLFDFKPTADVELQLKQGDTVVVKRTDAGDGWWEGEIDGQRGLFPSSFVKMLPPAAVSNEEDEWAHEPPNMATPNLSLPLTPQPSSKKEHMQTLLMPLTLEGLYDPLKAAELFVRDHTDIRITAGPRWDHKPLNLTIAVREGRRDATKGVGFRQLKYFEVSTKELKSRVQRKYKHFLWLYDKLADSFPCISLPPPPIKQSGGAQQEFIESRRKGLERFLNRVAKHPVLGCTKILYEFLTASGDKEWRIGSKHISRASRPGKKLFGAPIYHAVHYPPYNVPVNQLSEIEKFSKFSETLEGTVGGLTRTCQTLLATQSEIASCLKGLGKDLQCLARGVEHPQGGGGAAKIRKSSHPVIVGGAVSDDDSEEEDDKTNTAALIAQWSWREDDHFTRLMMALDDLGGKVRQVSRLHHTPQSVEEEVVEGFTEYSAILHTLPLLVKLHEDAMTAYNESRQKGSKKEAEDVREQCDTLNNIVLAEFDYFSGVMLGDLHTLVLNLIRAQADYHNRLAKEWEELYCMFQASALPRQNTLKRSTTVPDDMGAPMIDGLSDDLRPRAASSGDHAIEEPVTPKPPHSNYVNLPPVMSRPYVNLSTHSSTTSPGVYENWQPTSPAHKTPQVPILPTSPIPPPTILKRTVKSPEHQVTSPPEHQVTSPPPSLSQGSEDHNAVDETPVAASNKDKPVPLPRRNLSCSTSSTSSAGGDKRADTPDGSRGNTPEPETLQVEQQQATSLMQADSSSSISNSMQASSLIASDATIKPSEEVKPSIPAVAMVTKPGPSKSFSQTSEFPKVSLKPTTRTLPRGAAPARPGDDGSELMRKLTQRRHKIDRDLAKKMPASNGETAASDGSAVASYRIHLDNPEQNLTKYGIIEDEAGGSYIV